MGSRRLLKIVAVALLLAAYGICYSQMSQLRAKRPPETKRAQALALDPTLLRIVSGPFKGLMADYLNIKASVFMGGAWEVTEEDWEAVYTLLKQSLYLDPLFFQTGYYVQGLLSWRKGMHQRAADLLQIHAEERYWDWEPMFYLGFNYSYYLNDDASAAKYLKLASERPHAPAMAASLAARLSQKAGHTLTAIALLKTMYESAQDEKRREFYRKRLEGHLAVRQLELAVGAFEKRHDRRPDSLEELVTSGTIKELPQNPFFVPFIYDVGKGLIYFDENRPPLNFDLDRSLLPIDENR